MGIANAAKGYMEIQGLMQGIGVILIFGIIGAILIAIGSSNMNNKVDPNYTDLKANKVSTNKKCKTFRPDGTCKQYDYDTTYDTSECKNYSPTTIQSGNSGYITLSQHKDTKECKTPSLTKGNAIIMLVIGCLLLLSASSVASCMMSSDCRTGMGFLSMISGSSGNSRGGSSYGNTIRNIRSGFM
jgi:hypothetical protein